MFETSDLILHFTKEKKWSKHTESKQKKKALKIKAEMNEIKNRKREH